MNQEESFSSFYLYKEHKELFLSEPTRLFLQYKSHRINLLTGIKENSNLEDFFDLLGEYSCEAETEKATVIHLFYELGFYCCELIEHIEEGIPLAIFCEYNHVEKRSLPKSTSFEHCDFIPLVTPRKDEYVKQFEQVYHSLIEGDCYQVNLTAPTIFRLNRKLSVRDYFKALWDNPMKVGAYAHGTYINSLDQLFLSNSPECLFQIHEGYISSMPIKGTLKVDDEKKREEAWELLKNSKKDSAELNMITDLIRNDLTKLTSNPSYVKAKRKSLNVPELIHQFSVVESPLSKDLTMANVVKSLFPGGSITGAPKKRVMEIIHDVEKDKRGFYCGSTILLYQKTKIASINIRSIDVNFTADEITYGSGGGITLESNVDEEFLELLAKLKSFLHILC